MLAVNLQNNGRRYRFSKGNIPANKGKKMPANVYEKARKTMFRKGNIPANHKPIGYERINADGYIESCRTQQIQIKAPGGLGREFRDYSSGI